MVPTEINVRERISLHVCNTEKFKAESISVTITHPLSRERYLTTLLFSVLLRGCERYPTQRAINRRLDELYGTAISVRDYTVGDGHVVGLFADFVSKAYLPSDSESVFFETLSILRDLLFHPALDENGLLNASYVESEKQLQCDAIRAKKNSPRGYAVDRLRSVMLGDLPCGGSYYGTVEEVESVTPERLTAHWHELIDGAHLDFFYVGGTDRNTVAQMLCDVFAKELSEGGVRALPAAYSAPLPVREVQRCEEALAVTQGQLAMGYRFEKPLSGRRYFAATMLYELLGASPVSKLFVNVRERLGICYSCNAVVSCYTGIMIVTCGLSAQNREAAERAITREIEAIANGEISDTEWEAALESRWNSLSQIKDNPGGIDRFYTVSRISGEARTLDGDCEAIKGIEREEVCALARELALDTVFFLQPTREEDECDEEN